MRGHDTTKDTPTGAVVRRNVTGLLEVQGMVPRDLYGALGLTAERFWGQFSKRVQGPRLDIVERMAVALDVPLWRLLVREGETPSKWGSLLADPRAIRRFIRCSAEQLAIICKIPTEPRNGETPLNFCVRQNVAIGCWEKSITEAALYYRLNIPRATWYSWFRRRTGIAMVDIWRIAEALDMEPWELAVEVRMGDSGDERTPL